jgi:hypothetical protein
MKHYVSEIPFNSVPLDELDLLRISETSKKKYTNILTKEIKVPMDQDGKQETIELRKLLN